MRRNNENLMVLSGDDPARRSGHPLPLADVLRAAVSEIEQYQRVVVRSTPAVDVLGYASGDLVRLVAELLDNATSFSPPKTQVRIGGQTFADGSVRIEIRDEGIAMAPAELADANGRLTAADTEDVPVSRQMGLYVVGRLAKRHSIAVSLEVPPDGGLLAVVHVPSELVKPGSGPVRPADGVLNGHRPNGSPANGNMSNGNGNPANGNGGARPLPAFAANPPSQPDLAPVPKPAADWGSFAGSAIGDTAVTAKLDPSGFTWFINGQPPAPVSRNGDSTGQPVTYTDVGLPRRVPKSHAVPNLVQPSAAPVRQRAAPAQSGAPVPAPQRNPTRARGFLDDYQAGIRQGQPGSAESAARGGTHGTGQGEAQ
jgi:hypothetical protein